MTSSRLVTLYLQFDITVLAVETAHGRSRKTYDKFMASQGYVSYGHIKYTDEKLGLYVDDTIFVKKTYLQEQGLSVGSS